jgi:5-methylcytosine-specific restriction endonuclease McrA
MEGLCIRPQQPGRRQLGAVPGHDRRSVRRALRLPGLRPVETRLSDSRRDSELDSPGGHRPDPGPADGEEALHPHEGQGRVMQLLSTARSRRFAASPASAPRQRAARRSSLPEVQGHSRRLLGDCPSRPLSTCGRSIHYARVNRNGSRWLPAWKRIAIYLRDSFQCQYCQKDLRNSPRADVTLDHIICRTTGGTHEADNLITACRSCNSSRQDQAFEAFASQEVQARVRSQLAQPLNTAFAKSLLAA